MEFVQKEKYDLSDLRQVFALLRGENGCPWDRVQTHESIRANLIEETYEVVEAIDNSDLTLMKEELGDLLLQVVFHAGIEEEKGSFSLDDVISDVTEKLVRRHPHVFGDVSADDPDGAIDAWEKAKGVEKTERKTAVDAMLAVPPSLPALMRAQKISKKAAKYGFDTNETVKDGVSSLLTLADCMNDASISSKIDPATVGDALFAVSAFCERVKIDSELELTKRSDDFIRKFPEM